LITYGNEVGPRVEDFKLEDLGYVQSDNLVGRLKK
jgi:hypothetical protein